VTVSETHTLTTSRLDTVISANSIPIDTIDFLNFDIQGVELRALKSMETRIYKQFGWGDALYIRT
jgi:hypothetical protein